MTDTADLTPKNSEDFELLCEAADRTARIMLAATGKEPRFRRVITTLAAFSALLSDATEWRGQVSEDDLRRALENLAKNYRISGFCLDGERLEFAEALCTKAQTARRARLKAAGLKQVSLWLPPEEAKRLQARQKALIAEYLKRDEELEALRKKALLTSQS